MRPRIKICCIASLEEARLAIDAGADAIGLVGEMPTGPGVIEDDLAREIAAAVPPPVASVLLTQRTRACDIADHVAACGTSAVQIVNHIDPGEYPELIERLPPATRRIQVIHVEGPEARAMIEVYAPYVHAFLLDSGRPYETRPELGGTGRVHDWAISAGFVAKAKKPTFLAGGLNAGNVAEALRVVRPYGLDICSGVRTDDKLSPDKLHSFMANARP